MQFNNLYQYTKNDFIVENKVFGNFLWERKYAVG